MKGCTQVITRFSRSGKSWKKTTTEATQLTGEEYHNATDESWSRLNRALGGYERITRNYTYAGYTPVKIVSISPDRTKRVIREFKDFTI